MYAEPQSVTISGSAKSLNRTSSVLDGSKWATTDRGHQMSLTHTYGRRHRHSLRFQLDSLTANPLVSGQNINQSMTLFITVDVPPGYDTAAAKAVVDGVLANLSATSGANITKLIGGES